MSSDTNSLEGKAVCTPVKSAFLTPCRRMGLKRKPSSTPTTSSPLLLVTGCKTPSIDSPLSKKPLVGTTLDLTPKRKIISRRQSLHVTRVERSPAVPLVENEPKIADDSSELVIEDLEASVAKKRKELSLLQKGVHPLQIEADRLNGLTDVWRSGCKTALEDLLELLHKNSEAAAQMLSMKVLISNLDIPPDLLHFDDTKEEFY